MSAAVYVIVLTLGEDHCAIFRRPGQPDEFLVDKDGRPQRFASASVALRQGRKALAVADAPPTVSAGEDILGIRAWRAAKDTVLQEERDRVFGAASLATIERNGRTITIQRRKRRR